MYRNTDHWLLLYIFVRLKILLTHWLSTEIHVIGTERRAQARPHLFNFWTVGSKDPWPEPPLNPRSGWLCCAVILWKIDHLGLIPASSDTVESEGWQCWIKYWKTKIPVFYRKNIMQVCKVSKKKVKKFTPITACTKEPKEICAPAGCGFKEVS